MPSETKNRATVKELIEQLKSEECFCGRPKKRLKSLCYSCYRRLPDEMQADLYQGIGAGYGDALDAAIKYLSD